MNFLIDLANHPSFRAADVHTGFIPQHFDTLFPPVVVPESRVCQAAVALLTNEWNAAALNARASGNESDPFHIGDNLRLNYEAVRDLKLKTGETVYRVAIKRSANGDQLNVRIDDGEWKVVRAKRIADARFTIRSSIDGDQVNFSAVIAPHSIAVFDEAGKTEFEIVAPKFLTAQDAASGSASAAVMSPMPGVLDKMLVKAGDAVKKGDPLAVIIAMKMEHVLKAPKDAVVKSVGGKPGDNVAKGAAIVTFEKDDESSSDEE